MSETTDNPEVTTPNKKFDLEAQISKYRGMVDGWVDKFLGLIGDHPWEKWIAVENRYVDQFLPFGVAIAGCFAFIIALVMAIRMDAPFSTVLDCIWILVGTVLAMHLSTKTLALVRSLVEKHEQEMIRPELAYILKVLFGLGGIVMAIRMLLCFTVEGLEVALVCIGISVIASIVFTRPEFVGMKFGYPTNVVEEIISLVLIPLKICFSLFTSLLGLVVVGGLVIGICKWFSCAIEASLYFGAVAIAPVVLPLAGYIMFVFIVFTLDLYRSICSVPRKLDEVRKAVETK